METQKNCIIHCRVSKPSEAHDGESLKQQEDVCRTIAERKNLKVLGIWKEPFSGRKEHRPYFDEMMDYIKNNYEKIDYLMIRSIDRFTRGGSSDFDRLKKEFGQYGIEIIDSMGIIQPPQNTLEYLGVKYDWSNYYPSGASEIAAAEDSKNEVRNMLSRTIGRQIVLTRQGYHTGVPDDGYLTKKIVTSDGKKKTIQVEDPERGKYYKEMFGLRANGSYSDAEIVDKINAMGFKSKERNRWNKGHDGFIGKMGGIPLTIKQFQKNIKKPIYAGIICEKWTSYLPVRAQYDSLISIETFNKANRGKVFIKEEKDGAWQILYDYSPIQKINKKNKNNPEFPYKNVILCPTCGKPLKGSFSRGKSGNRFPSYFCERGKHKRFSVQRKILHENIEKFIRTIKFTDEYLIALEDLLLTESKAQLQDIVKSSADISKNVSDLKIKQVALFNEFSIASQPTTKRMIEEKIEELEQQINNTKEQRNDLELSEDEIKYFIKETSFLVEHLEKLLLDSNNMFRQQNYFGLLFDSFPTYNDIVNGTPKLSLVFEINEDFKKTKSLITAPQGIEPWFSA